MSPVQPRMQVAPASLVALHMAVPYAVGRPSDGGHDENTEKQARGVSDDLMTRCITPKFYAIDDLCQ